MNNRPRIIELVGLAGTGKSTLVKSMGQRNHEIRIFPLPKVRFIWSLTKRSLIWLFSGTTAIIYPSVLPRRSCYPLDSEVMKSLRGSSSSACVNSNRWRCSSSSAPARKWNGTTRGKRKTDALASRPGFPGFEVPLPRSSQAGTLCQCCLRHRV